MLAAVLVVLSFTFKAVFSAVVAVFGKIPVKQQL